MNELHLFAGAGGGILGGMLLGHTCVCAVEIEPYRRKVLLQRQRDGILPKFPIWDDVRTFDGKPWRGKVDIVCGGFPCQDISVGNPKGIGIEGERSGLWSEMHRVIGEVQPHFVLVENSPNLLNRGIGRVLGDLASLGYDSRWGVFRACDAGFIHKRERLFVFAHSMQIGREWGWKKWPKEKQTHQQFEGLLQQCASVAISSGRYHRMADGVADRVDRLKAIGDGQVPAVVALAWRTLTSGID